jgi:hypothetical protein
MRFKDNGIHGKNPWDLSEARDNSLAMRIYSGAQRDSKANFA